MPCCGKEVDMLEDVVQEVRDNLNNMILPFWKSLKDDEYGGFYGEVGHEGEVHKQADKGCIMHGRILWTFSNAYMALKDESLLPYATHAYEYLTGPMWDEEEGGVYWAVTYDGKPADEIKHSYTHAFTIYALASYYDASGNEEALARAMELYDLLESDMRDPLGYREAFTRKFKEAHNDKLSENGVMAARTMNTALHVYEAYTELYRVTGEEKMADSMRRVLDMFMNRIVNLEKHRCEVFFGDEMNSLIDLHSFGHDIESAWLIDRGLRVLGDAAYSKKLAPIAKDFEECVYREGMDDKHASVYLESVNGVLNKERHWWVQCEAMIGFYNAWQKDPSKEEYIRAVEDIWQYVKNHMIDPRPESEWFEKTDAEDKVIPGTPLAGIWKCPYHNSRMCLELIRRWEKEK